MIKSHPLQSYNGSDKKIQGIRSDRVPEEIRTEVHNTAQEMVTKTIPKKQICMYVPRQKGCPRRPYRELRKEEK